MAATKPTFTNHDEYIATFPADVQKVLTKLRNTIAKAAPDAEEHISYALPAYKHHGWLIYYSAAKNHVAVSFPSYKIFDALADLLAPFECGKTSIKFPLDQPLPTDVIRQVVEHRITENLATEAKKKPKK
jgi:uncharacterized protein YdhG (YjbR/CyaY superfamily)